MKLNFKINIHSFAMNFKHLTFRLDVIHNFVSLKKGFGKKLIKKIQKQINCPIVLQAGYLKYGDYVYAQQNNDFSYIKSLAKYYKKLGFKNINDDIGDYNESIIMIYNH